MTSDFNHRRFASRPRSGICVRQLLFLVPMQAGNRTGALVVGIRHAVVGEEREAGICAGIDAQLGNGLLLMGACPSLNSCAVSICSAGR